MAILTISRQFGSGAKAVGENVAKAMDYEHLDRARMLEELKSQGQACEAWTREFEEHYPDAWGRYDWSFRGFVAVTQSMILNHAKKDRVVISGPGAGFLLRGVPHALTVRIIASMQSRLDRVQSDAVGRETAKWLIEKADEEMAHAVYTVYGRHWDKPSEYDMVFDVSAATDGGCCQRDHKGACGERRTEDGEGAEGPGDEGARRHDKGCDSHRRDLRRHQSRSGGKGKRSS